MVLFGFWFCYCDLVVFITIPKIILKNDDYLAGMQLFVSVRTLDAFLLPPTVMLLVI